MEPTSLSALAKLLAPIAPLVFPKIKGVWGERRAAKDQADSLAIYSSHMDKTLHRIQKFEPGADWWSKLLNWLGHNAISTDTRLFEHPHFQNWLSEHDVQCYLKRIAEARVMENYSPDKFSKETDLLRERYSHHSGELKTLADGTIDLVVSILAAGYISPLNHQLQIVFGGIQNLSRKMDAHNKEVEKQFAEQKDGHDHTHSQLNDVVEILESIKGQLNSNNTDTGHGENHRIDRIFNRELDQYRDMINNHQPQTAIGLLEKFKNDNWEDCSDWIKFRTLTNLGASYLALNNFNEAKTYFVKAYDYAPEKDLAITNRVLAFIITSEIDEAKRLSDDAILRLPESGKAYAFWISARIDDEGTSEPERFIPASLQENGEVLYALGRFYQHRNNLEANQKWMLKAFKADEHRLEVMTGYAESVLQGFFVNESKRIGGQFAEEDLVNLTQACQLLDTAWQTYRNSETAEINIHVALNLGNAQRLLGRNDKHQAVIDEAIGVAADNIQVIRHQMMIALDNNDYIKASKIYEEKCTNKNKEMHPLYIQSLMGEKRYHDALTQIDEYMAVDGSKDKDVLIDGFKASIRYELNGDVDGEQAAIELIKNWPSEIIAYEQASNIFGKIGNKEKSAELLVDAIELLNGHGTYFQKYVIADALYRANDFKNARPLYNQLVECYSDTEVLRRLFICLHELDCRKEFNDLLSQLPAETRNLEFYHRVAAFFFFKTGQFSEAKTEFESFLTLNPSDLNMRLNWINILYRLDQKEQIKKYLENYPIFPDALPEDQITLARHLDLCGQSSEALKRAYELRRSAVDSPQVHMGYMALFLNGNAGSVVRDYEVVQPGCAFLIEHKSGQQEWYIIEDEVNDRKDYELKSDHPLAVAANQRKKGESFTFQRNDYDKVNLKIVDILDKYVRMLHDCSNNFNLRFPNEKCFMSISVQGDNDDTFCFDSLFKILDEQKERADKALEKYRNEPIPAAFLSSLLGKNALDVWCGLLADPDKSLFSCIGRFDEREKALKLLDQENQKYIVDPLTLHSIWDLDLQEAVTATLGALGITQSTIDFYEHYVANIDPTYSGDQMGTIAKQGDKYALIETSKENIENEIVRIKKLIGWLNDLPPGIWVMT